MDLTWQAYGRPANGPRAVGCDAAANQPLLRVAVLGGTGGAGEGVAAMTLLQADRSSSGTTMAAEPGAIAKGGDAGHLVVCAA